MKKQFLILCSVLCFAISVSAQKKDKMNSLFDLNHLTAPDRIPCDSIIYYAHQINPYYPMFADEMFIMMTSLDEVHDFVYRKVGKYFEKLPLPINNEIFTVKWVNLITTPSTGSEQYQIVCEMSHNGTVKEYMYDIQSHKIEEKKYE